MLWPTGSDNKGDEPQTHMLRMGEQLPPTWMGPMIEPPWTVNLQAALLRSASL